MDTKPTIISKDFVTEVAKYFMAFLETDFRKRTQPKRNLTSRVNNGLKVGLYLDKYPTLYRELYKNFVSGFTKETITVQQGQYTTKISDRLVSLLEQKIDQLDAAQIKGVVSDMAKDTTQYRLDNLKDYDNYFESSTDTAKQRIASGIVVPLLNDIEKSLEAAGWSTEGGLYQLEVDATAKVYSLLENTIAQVLEEFFANSSETKMLVKELSELMSVESVQSVLKEFFKEFNASDAYSEVAQLSRNKDMLDKTELYIYFGEISINKFSFPLFYVPITVQQNHPSLELQFDNRVFLNVKAIDFVVQQNNATTNSNESVAGNFERIIYYEDKKQLLPAMQKVIDNLRDVLALSKEIDLKATANQQANNMIASLSNRLQLFLFDKSDEALINDYEEIIDDQGELTSAFAELIDSFVTENPTSYIEEVAEEWGDKSISDKLIVDSPIALNEEQKQVLLALQKDDCKVAILEGPPGTGKSHTITAIVCKALLEGQSVLVLSDKEEALDVVQDKITSTLSGIRHDKNFQNPILRLGKSSRGLSKVIEGQALDKVREHMRAYRSQQDEFAEAEKQTKADANSSLNGVVDLGGKVNLVELEHFFQDEKKFDGIDWITNEEIDAVSEDLVKVHKAVLKLQNSQALYLFALNDELDADTFAKFKAEIVSYSEARGSFTTDTSNFISSFKSLNPSSQQAVSDQLTFVAENQTDALKFLKSVELPVLSSITEESTFADILLMSSTYSNILEVSSSLSLYSNKPISSYAPLQQLLRHEGEVGELMELLNEYIQKLQSMKSRFIGYNGKRTEIDKLTRALKQKVPYFVMDTPEKHIEELIIVVDAISFSVGKLKQLGVSEAYWKDTFAVLYLEINDTENVQNVLSQLGAPAQNEFVKEFKLQQATTLIENIRVLKLVTSIQSETVQNPYLLKLMGSELGKVLSHPLEAIEKLETIQADIDEYAQLKELQSILDAFSQEFPSVSERLNLNETAEGVHKVSPIFTKMTEESLREYLSFKTEEQKFENHFANLATDNFAESTDTLQMLNAAKMANILDSRIINYVDNHAADIRTLKSMLKSKQKFPKVLFGDLKQAFPCILAGIRDYATYIPLEKDLFDLVIIDEASQVSIAQALPALIRGKKILVLGDEKQFSNVKAGNASILTNNKFRSNLLTSLKEAIENQDKGYADIYSSRVNDNFNVKKSILDFCRFITNYQTMLKKHFRCYPEIIAYSNENFYGGDLQCMKARALPIGEVLKFSYVEKSDEPEQYVNTNLAEAEFVLTQFTALKDKGYEGSLAVITPHREQATFINNLLNESQITEWLKDHALKVMTFDTCQGEERDYIMYSMVASKTVDKHWTIFPVSMATSEKEGKEFGTREQRLNVGFSRAKETVHFVLSKPITDYWGEVKNALVFYENKLNTTEHIIGGTDESSAMEPLVQNYFYQTEFYKTNKDSIEFVPQFPLGDYLSSLDRNYSHPKYKVDFLLTFNDRKIIIEYDGFKEHFIEGDNINANNFMSYLKPDDVYRQKVLEGYGYKFLRLNKFNLGDDPISSMNELLTESVKKKTSRQGLLIHT